MVFLAPWRLSSADSGSASESEAFCCGGGGDDGVSSSRPMGYKVTKSSLNDSGEKSIDVGSLVRNSPNDK